MFDLFTCLGSLLTTRSCGAIALRHTEFGAATCGTIRLKLLKIGARVTVSIRRIKIAIASACPYQAAFVLAHAHRRAPPV